MLLEFQQECEVLAISTGSILSKVVFTYSSKEEGGVAGINLVEGKEVDISHGMVREDSGYSYRAMVLIARMREVLSRVVSDLPIGCGKNDALRMVKESDDDIGNASDKKEVTEPIGYDGIQ